jgi:hypothetical protein
MGGFKTSLILGTCPNGWRKTGDSSGKNLQYWKECFSGFGKSSNALTALLSFELVTFVPAAYS